MLPLLVLLFSSVGDIEDLDILKVMDYYLRQGREKRGGEGVNVPTRRIIMIMN